MTNLCSIGGSRAHNLQIEGSDIDLTSATYDGKAYQMITLLAGNIVEDNFVDNSDLVAFLGQFGKSGSADINGDSFIDNSDLLVLLSAFGKSASSITY